MLAQLEGAGMYVARVQRAECHSVSPFRPLILDLHYCNRPKQASLGYSCPWFGLSANAEMSMIWSQCKCWNIFAACLLIKWQKRQVLMECSTGVATIISGLDLKVAAWTCKERPPTISATLTSVYWANFWSMLWICNAWQSDVHGSNSPAQRFFSLLFIQNIPSTASDLIMQLKSAPRSPPPPQNTQGATKRTSLLSLNFTHICMTISVSAWAAFNSFLVVFQD